MMCEHSCAHTQLQAAYPIPRLVSPPHESLILYPPGSGLVIGTDFREVALFVQDHKRIHCLFHRVHDLTQYPLMEEKGLVVVMWWSRVQDGRVCVRLGLGLVTRFRVCRQPQTEAVVKLSKGKRGKPDSASLWQEAGSKLMLRYSSHRK